MLSLTFLLNFLKDYVTNKMLDIILSDVDNVIFYFSLFSDSEEDTESQENHAATISPSMIPESEYE